MEITTPELPGLTSAFLLGHRRRPGSAVGPANIEEVITIILKRAYTIVPSDSDPALGRLVPRDDGPEIFEADLPGGFLANGDFADGLDGWSETGGAEANEADESVVVTRNGPAGDLRRNAAFGRTLRDRKIGFSAKAASAQGNGLPQVLVVAGGQSQAGSAEVVTFPAPGDQPIDIFGTVQFSGAVTASSLSMRLGTMPADGQSVTYSEVSAAGVVYESDLVAFKPEADLIVIADDNPVPVSLSVNGTVRMSQQAFGAKPLTGLGWASRSENPRKDEAGVFDPPPTQVLPDTFSNTYYNGYRRDRRQGGSVPYPQPGDEISLIDNDGDLYGFVLTTGTPRATHAWFTGKGDDSPAFWREREIGFALDTLVIERDRDEAYAVWRSVWPSSLVPPGASGPIPIGDNRGVTVRWEGG